MIYGPWQTPLKHPSRFSRDTCLVRLVEHTNAILQSFINRISDASQRDEPPQFRGGIIADPMGLGKTLTMIALVAISDCQAGEETIHAFGEDFLQFKMPTLIIVTPPCIFF